MRKKYKVEVDCANCASKMERALEKVAGIESANIAFMTRRMSIEFADGADVNMVLDDVERACKKVESDFVLFR